MARPDNRRRARLGPVERAARLLAATPKGNGGDGFVERRRVRGGYYLATISASVVFVRKRK